MAEWSVVTCYSFIKHCLEVWERRGEGVRVVMNGPGVTSSLLTPQRV